MAVMAPVRMLSLFVLASFASLSLASQGTVTSLETRPLDDIKLPPSVPTKIKMTDKPADPAGKLVKVRYGPFTVPPNSMFAPLPEFAGGVKITKPCTECYLGAFQGGLEYEDGSEANVDTGMYMHHFVIINRNKPDWLCGLRLGGMFRPQWIYNSGNERPPVRLNSKYKFGMRIDKEDEFDTAAEIMNMGNTTKTVYATVIYEVIPLDTPGYREATHLRLDIWLCGGSDVPAHKGAYKYTSRKYKSPYSGVILHNDGHGHDGTTEVKMYINDKVFCNSIQYYGLRPTTVQPHDIAIQHGDGHSAAMQYISDAVACEDYGRVEKGDELWTESYYNGSKYPQMVFKGHLEGQMGINFLYIGRDESTLKDRLRIESGMDELPLEFNFTSAFAMMPGANGFRVNNISTVFAQFGLSNLNFSNFIPGVPADFNLSDPHVVVPFSPFRPPSFSFNITSLLPGIPGAEAITSAISTLNPLIMSVADGMLKSFLPGLPKDFSLSKIYVPGGIVLSEMEPLMLAMRDSPFLKSLRGNSTRGFPFGGQPLGGQSVGGPSTHVLTRSLYQLGMIPDRK